MVYWNRLILLAAVNPPSTPTFVVAGPHSSHTTYLALMEVPPLIGMNDMPFSARFSYNLSTFRSSGSAVGLFLFSCLFPSPIPSTMSCYDMSPLPGLDHFTVCQLVFTGSSLFVVSCTMCLLTPTHHFVPPRLVLSLSLSATRLLSVLQTHILLLFFSFSCI